MFPPLLSYVSVGLCVRLRLQVLCLCVSLCLLNAHPDILLLHSCAPLSCWLKIVTHKLSHGGGAVIQQLTARGAEKCPHCLERGAKTPTFQRRVSPHGMRQNNREIMGKMHCELSGTAAELTMRSFAHHFTMLFAHASAVKGTPQSKERFDAPMTMNDSDTLR